MLPFPKLFNNYQNPARPNFLFATDVMWRKDVSGTGWRPAIEGTEFEFSDTDQTVVKFLPGGFNTFYSISFPYIAGKSLFFRFKFNGTYDRCVMQPWNNGALFTAGITPNQWYEAKVTYNATSSRWLLNNSQWYDGSKLAEPSFFFGLFGGPNSVEFDVGQNGGLPPAGFEWWYNPRTQ